eukprot:17938-Heterococcus_DN1.PRE.4
MRTAVHNAEVYPDCFARLFALMTDCICLSNTCFTVHTHCACAGSYVMSVRSGNLIFTAGHIPQQADGSLITGKVGADMTAEDAAKAAELCALHIMSTIKVCEVRAACYEYSSVALLLQCKAQVSALAQESSALQYMSLHSSGVSSSSLRAALQVVDVKPVLAYAIVLSCNTFVM